MLTLLITLPLLFAPPAEPTEATDPPTAPPPAEVTAPPEYTAAIEHLAQADSDANLSPAESSAPLAEALAALADFAPELATDTKARELRAFARLNLARAHLLAGNSDLAQEAMDEAIRENPGAPLPADVLGSEVAELYAIRLAALEEQGHGRLEVRCVTPCKVYLNENEIDLQADPLPLVFGTYRVWIEDLAGEHPPKRMLIEINEADTAEEIEFAPYTPPPPPPPPPPLPDRIMPRWAEVLLVVAGTGLTTAGSVLVALDNDDSYTPMAAGAATLAVGAAGLTTGIITLSIDERRLAQAEGHQATLSWTLRF
jgi:hypothetical protein